ncbi:GTP-binding protein [Maribacter sp. MAR_2009_72]|uniref:GTP-binding protein n=1 Tax=Maribacter sp. MAR_2009_72 TaxID=1250050 RepID=UPI0011993125|nr:GTP-binding protein [Maribacter sp. MAR_2009_72]TVZ14705.1 hypothetical protein JM81_0911 [Maribacter sp. MAR_2009_72]
MKPLPNDIVLRPRFQLTLVQDKETILTHFQHAMDHPFVIKRLDEHVFIRFNNLNNHFWSPQLHLEIVDEENTCKLYGVFGPNPTLWTFFMFIHFVIAILFIVMGIWAYSSASLGKNYHIQLGGMVILILLWTVLYFLGRAGKKKGKPQMLQLYNFMMNVLTE